MVLLIRIENFYDNAIIDDMINKYVPLTLKYQNFNFSFDSSEYEKLLGKKFQVIQVEDIPEALPFLSTAENKDIEKDIIYVRRGTKCQRAKAEEVERILNRRIETQYSSSLTLDLEDHLKQLKLLYGQIERKIKVITKEETTSLSKLLLGFASFFESDAEYEFIPNPAFPTEDYEHFIAGIINNKKIKIEKVLDLK